MSVRSSIECFAAWHAAPRSIAGGMAEMPTFGSTSSCELAAGFWGPFNSPQHAPPTMGGASVMTSAGEVETYNRAVRSEVEQLKAAVDKFILDRWGPEGFFGSVPDVATLDKRKKDRDYWEGYYPIGASQASRDAAFLFQWEGLQARNFTADGSVKKWTAGSLGDFPLLSSLYDEVAKYRIRNREWEKRYETASGKPAPIIKATPDAAEVDKEVDKTKPAGPLDGVGAAAASLASSLAWVAAGVLGVVAFSAFRKGA